MTDAIEKEIAKLKVRLAKLEQELLRKNDPRGWGPKDDGGLFKFPRTPESIFSLITYLEASQSGDPYLNSAKVIVAIYSFVDKSGDVHASKIADAVADHFHRKDGLADGIRHALRADGFFTKKYKTMAFETVDLSQKNAWIRWAETYMEVSRARDTMNP